MDVGPRGSVTGQACEWRLCSLLIFVRTEVRRASVHRNGQTEKLPQPSITARAWRPLGRSIGTHSISIQASLLSPCLTNDVPKTSWISDTTKRSHLIPYVMSLSVWILPLILWIASMYCLLHRRWWSSLFLLLASLASRSLTQIHFWQRNNTLE